MKTLKILIFLTFLLNYVNTLFGQKRQDGTSNQRVTVITGEIKDNIKHDTLLLILHGQFFSFSRGPEWRALQVLKTTTDNNGKFKFQIQTKGSPFHFSLLLSTKRNSQGWLDNNAIAIADYLIEPRDSINVVFDRNGQYYTGKGSDLLEAQYQVQQTDKNDSILKSSDNGSYDKDTKKWLRQKDSLLTEQLKLIATYSAKLSPISYAIVRADIIGANGAFVCGSISPRLPFLHSLRDKGMDRNLHDILKQLENGFADIDPTDRSCLSPKYINYLYLKLQMEQKYDGLINNKNQWGRNYFSAICKQYTGILRDKLLAWWLLESANVNDLQPEYVANAMSIMKTPVYIEIVQGLEATYAKGQPVTDFDFKDAQGRTVQLADFKGKVVLVDLWFSGCTGCVRVAAGLPLVEETFKNRSDIQFVSISIDKDKRLWLRSIDKNPSGKTYTHFTTSTTTYLYTAGTGDNNAFIKKYVSEGGYPSLLIIDREGRVFSSTPSRPVNTEMQSALIKELNEALTSK